jgi:hypothetical protein
VSRSTVSLLLATALALSATPVSAQTQIDPPTATQTEPGGGTSGIRQGHHADRPHGTDAAESRTVGDTDSPPANPPVKDETVGVGGSVDRAPRDIRDPFDE